MLYASGLVSEAKRHFRRILRTDEPSHSWHNRGKPGSIMIAQLFSLALLGLAAQGKVELNINAKDGEVITGERTFRVTVVSRNPVTQVEFYVGDDLRETDTSTPYEFRIDSLTEDDGPLRVKFAAYTTEGESSSRTLNLTIDNGVSKGADFHVQRGLDFLTESKWDDAILAGRIALKATPGHNPARVVMARAYLGKGVLDTAQKYAEDAAEANDPAAVELLSAINLQRAFNTFNRGGERTETLALIKSALQSAVEARQKTLNAALDKIGAPTTANLVAYADAAIRAGRYSLAATALSKPFADDNRNGAIANRLAFAQLRMGRLADARDTLLTHHKYGTPDAYSYALLGVVMEEMGNTQASDAAMREAVLSDSEDRGVRTAQAYIALRRGNTGVLNRLATDLAKDQGHSTEVNHYLTAVSSRLGRFEDSRRYFERAVLAEPINYDMYIERSNETVTIALDARLDPKEKANQLAAARVLMETAMAARPDSHEALTGLALVSLLQGNAADAVRYAQAAVNATPTYAAGHYALSAAFAAAGRAAEASAHMTRAGNLDKPNLEGRQVPTAVNAWRYFAQYGRGALISPPR